VFWWPGLCFRLTSHPFSPLRRSRTHPRQDCEGVVVVKAPSKQWCWCEALTQPASARRRCCCCCCVNSFDYPLELCFSWFVLVSGLTSAGKIEKRRVEFREEAVVAVVVVVVERDFDIARHWCGVALSFAVDRGWWLATSSLCQCYCNVRYWLPTI